MVNGCTDQNEIVLSDIISKIIRVTVTLVPPDLITQFTVHTSVGIMCRPLPRSGS